MVHDKKWSKGLKVRVVASDINHSDKREVELEYIGEGYLRDTSNGNEVWFNDQLFPNVYEGMCLSLGLTRNIKVCETYEVVSIL